MTILIASKIFAGRQKDSRRCSRTLRRNAYQQLLHILTTRCTKGSITVRGEVKAVYYIARKCIQEKTNFCDQNNQVNRIFWIGPRFNFNKFTELECFLYSTSGLRSNMWINFYPVYDGIRTRHVQSMVNILWRRSFLCALFSLTSPTLWMSDIELLFGRHSLRHLTVYW